MGKSKYDKYLVKSPLRGETPNTPPIYMSNKLVPESKILVQSHWVCEIPTPDPKMAAGHSHDFDEIIMYIGADPDNPEYLGAEIEGFMGDEVQITDNTSAIFIPKNVKHGLTRWRKFEKPHIMLAIKLNNGNP